MPTYIWWSIQFIPSGAFGYMKMQDGDCIGVYYEDGTLISPDEKVEYTCVNTDAPSPIWA
jgi:hypothetical protein